MSERRIEPLNDAERAWVVDECANARRLVELHWSDSTDHQLTPAILDRAFIAAYKAAPKSDVDYVNSTINAIGIAFGQYLVDTLGFQWCAVFDDDGQELAVIALPDTAKVLVFPPNLVAKRWFAGTTDFLVDVYAGIEDDLKVFRNSWAENRLAAEQSAEAPSGQTSWVRRFFGRFFRK